jgi:acyl-coenzyme A synthetase/AMP-(fatty) acid ligase
VRGRLVERLGLGPAAILFVAAGSLPKTPSGKIQRHAVQARYQAGELGTDAVIHFAIARRGGPDE